jgi:phosphopantetheinyl transferase
MLAIVSPRQIVPTWRIANDSRIARTGVSKLRDRYRERIALRRSQLHRLRRWQRCGFRKPCFDYSRSSRPEISDAIGRCIYLARRKR